MEPDRTEDETGRDAPEQRPVADESGPDLDPELEPESSVYASRDEGMEYRATAYVPVAYDNLAEAPDEPGYTKTEEGSRHRLLDLPKVPKLSHLLGPSAIMLGASLGSGETLFWPVLIAQNGWALYWAFWIGVLTQFVINTEIQRWTLATGESIFRAFDRVHRGWPLFFLLAGFASLGWPGWAASAAQVGSFTFGLTDWKPLGIGLMVLIWVSYQLSPVMYNVVERVQVVLVTLSAAMAVLLFFVIGSLDQISQVPAGAVSIGTLPPDTELAVFLGGLAYAGAGGYLNLSQSLWVREKGYGMGRYQGRIKNPLIGDEPETVHRDGFTFRPTSLNIERWKAWWRTTQLEHFLTFVVGLLVAATAMMLIAAEFAAGTSGGAIDMWLNHIAPQVGTIGGVLIHVVLFLALFTTEYAIVESFVRNSADILYESFGRDAGWSLPRIFWGLLTVFTGWGIVVLALPIPIDDAFGLLVLGAAMSGVMMWPYIALTLVVNATRLPEHAMPSWLRVLAMWWATAFFGFFSVLLIGDVLASDFGYATFATSPTFVGSGTGGSVLWTVFFVVQVYTMARSAQGKLAAEPAARDSGVESEMPGDS